MDFDPTKYGLKKTSASSQPSQFSNGQQSPEAPAQTQEQPQSSGLLHSLLNVPGRAIATVSNTAAKAISTGAQALGYNDYANRLWVKTQEIDKNGLDTGIGTYAPLGRYGAGDARGVKDAIGYGLEAGSFAVPGAASTIPRSALAGAAISGLSATGTALEDNASVSDALKAGAEAAPVGAITGGVLKGATKAIKPVIGAIKSTAGFAAKQITGLSPETIKVGFLNPDKLTEAQANDLTRNAVADKVHKAITSGLEDLSSTGKEYQGIRGLGTQVEIPKNMFKEVLGKYGLGMEDITDKTGVLTGAKILRTAESVPLGKGDIQDLTDFYLQYGKEGQLSSNGLLNTRQGLDKLKTYGIGLDKTDVSQKIASDLRIVYDQIAKKQLPGLSELDAKYAPQRQLFEKLQADYLNSNGSLKDNAINKIANLTGAGKREVLGRLEKVVPGISEDINISKALEDITSASGQKVGTYTRAAILGGAGLATGNIPLAIASALVSNPEVAIKIITKLGQANSRFAPVISRVISKMSTGGKLSAVEKKLVLYAIGQYIGNKEGQNSKQTKPAQPTQPADEYLKSLGL